MNIENDIFNQLSIQPEEESFIQYIDNREVDRGNYEKVENGKYVLASDKQPFTISLEEDNLFYLKLEKLNDGNPFVMVNISDTPGGFPQNFDDVDEYKTLLDDSK
ncbi:hypothetical protein [Ornithinibacillus contaminans]|uniref:hypothetical protein n=1 Tax=Ornithinibacillus contaminans TaxID=694055 RepID=UPI00064DC654|nr:hypothetical protein [Ornithinibacillus contaminans]